MVKTTDAATVEKLKRSRFRQQELKAWRPKTQPRHIIAVCFVVSTAFIAFGVLILAKGSDAIETEPVRYDNLASCDAALRKSPCYIDQTDPSDGIPLALKGVPLDPLCGHPARSDPRAGVNNTCTLTLTLTETMQVR